MRYSRAGIVAVLLAAEVFIGGAILWVWTGGHMADAGYLQTKNTMGELTRVDAGQAPHVVVDDPATRVVITASADGKVHVTDHTHRMGWFLGPYTPASLHVLRTADGVLIRRGNGAEQFQPAFVGIDFERTEVAVPRDTRLEIHCSGAEVVGVHANGVIIASNDGSLRFSNLESPTIDAATKDGSIRAADLRVGGGRLESDDGSIRLALAGTNLTIHAHTGDGSIRINGARVSGDDDSNAADYQVGTGGGALQISTRDGSIHINTNRNGAF